MNLRLRTTNYGAAANRLAELGCTFVGYDHREGRYVDLAIPPDAEAELVADPRFETDHDLGALIAEARRGAGMSLQAVATAAGLSKPHIWDLERGHSRNPTVEAMLGLSKALGVPFARVADAALVSYKHR